jgi:hypothetical protein
MPEPATALELRSYRDEEECAAVFQWGFRHNIEVRHPRIRVLGAPRAVHEAVDRWDARGGKSGLTLDAFLDLTLAAPSAGAA